LEQWDEDEEYEDEGDMPEHKRPKPKMDLSQFDPKDPEGFMKMSKKGQTLMTFVTLHSNPTREKTEELSSLWQTSLQNSHVLTDRYLIADDRFIFMFKDGSQAYDAKDFILEQEQVESMTIENKPYYGKFAKNKPNKDEL